MEPDKMKPSTEKHSVEDDTSRHAGASDAEYDDIETDAVDEKKLLNKLDLHILPGVAVLYLFSFLDRSNVGAARIEGLIEDLRMSGNQYLDSLTLFFVGYVLFEIPCNVILKRTTPKMWLPTLTLVWGVVATLMGVTQSADGFLAVRFFLGVAESGLFPGVVYYLSNWYRRTERVYRVALFFSAASLAGAFGGILAYGLGRMDGIAGLRGWRWIFIIEGLLTVVVAVAGYWFISNYPSTAGFLSPKERKAVLSRLTSDSDSTADEPFTWNAVLTCLRDPKCWLYCAVAHSVSLPLYTLALFLPTIIKDLGYTAARAQLLTVPPYALATLLTVTEAIISERLHHRSSFMIGSAFLAITGYAILIGNAQHVSSRPGVSYAGTFLAAAGIFPATALALAWPAMNVAGQTKRATACALQISIGQLGALMGTQVYRSSMAPGYARGHSVALAYMAGHAIIVSLLWVYLKRENARKERELAAAGSNAPTSQMTGDDDLRWKFNV